ncbi:MAG TPA: aldolase/citrate lyase family protein [Ramlibacter sp.]|uniref:aldolase/citrate lyase family protein n=1 Tax=Ramlibacter sp. TaxID=1917967 RepID=UPI002D08421A|nr:aldolase/citrate lyase family protein [Ramlibacter sp.]HVZ45343.1 aldolase/citrate lyase family protein [Ramlibacter sp.]
MLELIQITNDPAFARRCDALASFRLFVDLERLGKAERQAGRNTFISEHRMDDVGRVRDAVRHCDLMVRVNPLHDDTEEELDEVLDYGPDSLMLPMFQGAADLGEFARLVNGRAPIVALLETSAALQSLDEWIATPGLDEVYVGLNDLHVSLGLAFMFEPLANGDVERVARAAQARTLAFGFGGIARLDDGLLPGRDVLAEHLRLQSDAVILSRTFHREDSPVTFEREVRALREAEARLARRSRDEVENDRVRIAARIREIAAGLARP